LREEIGTPLPPSDQREYDVAAEAARRAMAPAEFACAWSEGRAMTIGQAVVYALSGTCQG
jgi:hypothetical protein